MLQKGKQNSAWSRLRPFPSSEASVKRHECSGPGATVGHGSYSTLLVLYKCILLVDCWLKWLHVSLFKVKKKISFLLTTGSLVLRKYNILFLAYGVV